MTNKPGVMVNILNEGTVTAGWESQIMSWMQSKASKYSFHLFFPSLRPIASNRNNIVKEFLKGSWDYLVMIDDDNPCHKNIFDFLDLDLPVVAAVYPGRDRNGIVWHVYQMREEDGKYYFKQYPPEYRDGLKKVDAIGTGVIVIKRWVIEKMVKEGWAPFEDIISKDGISLNSDDMGFCVKCGKLGIEVYAHFDYVGSHWKEVDLLWIANLVAYAAKTGRTNLPDEDRK